MAPRFSLTISDLSSDEALALVGMCGPSLLAKEPQSERTDTDSAKPKGVKVKAAATPATLPAGNAAAPAPAAPLAPTPPAAAPAPVAPEPVAAAPAGALTIEGLMAKARILGTGPLKQMALLAVLNAMGAPSLPKIPVDHYAAFDALLDASIAYVNGPNATIETLKACCAPGQYDKATETLIAASNAAMGL